MQKRYLLWAFFVHISVAVMKSLKLYFKGYFKYLGWLNELNLQFHYFYLFLT